MKKIEFVLLIGVLVGIMMKVLLLPYGGMLVGTSSLLLAIFYWPLGFFYFNAIPLRKIFDTKSYIHISLLQGLATVAFCILFSILTVGSFFKLLQWPGANLMLSTGLLGPIFLVGVWVINTLFRRKIGFNPRITLRGFVYLVLCGSLYFIPSESLVKVFYRDQPKFVEAYIKSANDPQNMALRKELEKIRQGSSE